MYIHCKLQLISYYKIVNRNECFIKQKCLRSTVHLIKITESITECDFRFAAHVYRCMP